jgi:hypothetical protein
MLRAAVYIVFMAAALFAPSLAFAQNAAEQQYLAARDAAIAATKSAEDRGEPTADTDKRNEAALADLQNKLRTIVGPVAISGVSRDGKLHIDTLSQSDIGFGALDALDFASPDGKLTVSVTTANLLRRWLADHKDWWEKNAVNVPQETAAALKSDAFYTQALSQDAAIMRYADLPVKKPKAADIALALLTASSQDQAPDSAGDLYLAAVGKGKVYILHATAAAKLGPIPACDEARKTRDTAAQAEQDVDRRFALQAQSDDEFRRCFAQAAPKLPSFAAMVKEADALLRRLPL